MQLTSIIVTAILALTVAAAPSIESRTSKSCSGDQVYSVKHSQCECKPGQYWDKNKCSYPSMAPTSCPKDQKLYCSSKSGDQCQYNKDKDQCKDNGWNALWCSSDKDAPQKCKDKYNPPAKPDCKGGQMYECESKSCKCPKPMKWNEKNQKCMYPAYEKPSCDWGKTPYCAKSKDQSCGYDVNNDFCSDDNTGEAVCSSSFDLSGLLSQIFAGL